jgi:predicted metal-binding membrane protein
MWCIMMTAMMLPSATPVLLLAAALNRRVEPERRPYGRTAFFAAGYVFVWTLFSLAAVAAQWGLAQSGALSGMMHASDGRLAGGLLIAAGLWQLTPLKHACLRQCRSPLMVLVQRRRKGNLGALTMGTEHGAYCLGCCWVLMALLFVGGVMNLYWIVGLALYVLAEKLLPAAHRLGRWAGAALVLAGVALVAGTYHGFRP